MVNIGVYVANKSKLIFANKIAQEAQVELDVMSRRIGRDFANEAAKYPPENEGNRPPAPYWQRGVGMIWGNGTVNPPSQQLGDNWSVRGVRTPFGGVATVSNPVTYAPFVHDNTKQAGFHAARGWRTMSQIAESIDMKIEPVNPLTYTVSEAGNYIRIAADKIRNFMQNVLNS